jgi:hypothetical protein
MGRIRCLTTFLALFLFALLGVCADAQTLTVENLNAARASVRAGYGGHGPDWDVSLDSPKLFGALRVRGGIGRGSWLGINQERPEPGVTRLSALALLYLRPRDVTFDFYGYVGVGVVAVKPHRSGMGTQTGTRIVLGMEGALGRWAIGPEFEFDLPRVDNAATARNALVPTVRAGLAFRRRF